ncbi:MAG TPA: RNA 2',3'-cyclic phosphodiesterase [Thermoplasmata archaeon]|nr:RNA 2',3'-cyclic phosphodiesterase [Thermoplasmata archaeon]
MRLFVAVEVGPPAEPPDGSGRHPAPEHLTLRFLGEVPRERLAEISSALADVAGATPPFDLVLEGVGAFPTSRNPRVVWVGVTQGRTEVLELAARVAAALDPTFPPSSRESFVPHLTLFRVRSPSQRRRAEALLSGAEPPPAPQTVHVREIYLKESTLTPNGAQHRTLESWALREHPSIPG